MILAAQALEAQALQRYDAAGRAAAMIISARRASTTSRQLTTRPPTDYLADISRLVFIAHIIRRERHAAIDAFI